MAWTLASLSPAPRNRISNGAAAGSHVVHDPVEGLEAPAGCFRDVQLPDRFLAFTFTVTTLCVQVSARGAAVDSGRARPSRGPELAPVDAVAVKLGIGSASNVNAPPVLPPRCRHGVASVPRADDELRARPPRVPPRVDVILAPRYPMMKRWVPWGPPRPSPPRRPGRSAGWRPRRSHRLWRLDSALPGDEPDLVAVV